MAKQVAFLTDENVITNVVVVDDIDSELLTNLIQIEAPGTTQWVEIPDSYQFFVDPTWTYSPSDGFRRPLNFSLVNPVWFEEDLDWREPYPTDGKDYGWDSLTNSWIEEEPPLEPRP
jgi:hypothetical protein